MTLQEIMTLDSSSSSQIILLQEIARPPPFYYKKLMQSWIMFRRTAMNDRPSHRSWPSRTGSYNSRDSSSTRMCYRVFSLAPGIGSTRGCCLRKTLWCQCCVHFSSARSTLYVCLDNLHCSACSTLWTNNASYNHPILMTAMRKKTTADRMNHPQTFVFGIYLDLLLYCYLISVDSSCPPYCCCHHCLLLFGCCCYCCYLGSCCYLGRNSLAGN